MKIGFIGCGKMASAMMSALIETGAIRREDITASDIDASLLKAAGRTMGIRTARCNEVLADAANVIFLAVKPFHVEAALSGLSGRLTTRHLVISIAAGVSLRSLASLIPRARMVRVMPNMACLVSESVSGYAMGPRTRGSDRILVHKLLSAFGEAMPVSERALDAVTAVGGSGPAFIALCLDGMIRGGIAEGLRENVARRIAVQTLLGAAKLLKLSGMRPSELISRIATPQGTTVAGLAELQRRKAAAAMASAVRAAARRSRQMRKQR